MTGLVDTHVLLWFAAGDPRLPKRYRDLLDEEGEGRFFSAASAFEISTKYSRGKLQLPEPPQLFIPRIINELCLSPLPVTVEHSMAVAGLPMHHGDPFDRLLVAQARIERLAIISGDKLLRKYDVKVLW